MLTEKQIKEIKDKIKKLKEAEQTLIVQIMLNQLNEVLKHNS